MKDIKDIEFSVDGLKLKGNLFYPDKINEKNPMRCTPYNKTIF